MASSSFPSSDTSEPTIHSFGAVHCAQNYDIANLSMVAVEGGYVAIDAGTSPSICETIDQRWRELADGPPLALFLTHFHTDHNGGAAVYRKESIPIWGQREFLNEVGQTQLLPNAYFSRGAKQFGWRLDTSTAQASGIGPLLRVDEKIRPPMVFPNQFVDHESTVEIGGTTFVLRSCPGETHDHLAIWLPEKRVLFAGDNIYRAFPNLYAIRGVAPRPIQGWIESLDYMRRLDPKPQLLVLGHTDPIEGEDKIHELLTVYRDAICFVHDSVVRGINAGQGPDELVDEIKLPSRFREHPYLQETYGTLGASIRAIYHGYLGWFDGESSHLVPPSYGDQAKWLAEELGGSDVLAERIEAAQQSGQHEKALWLSDLLLRLEPKSKRARGLKAEQVDSFGKRCENPLMRNWATTEVAELRGATTKIQKPRINGDTIADTPLEMLLQLFPARLDPHKTAKMKTSIGFDITDLDEQYTFFIREGVGEMAPGLDSTSELTIRATAANLKRLVLAGEANPLRRDFWQDLELVVPEQGILSPIRRLTRLAKLGQIFILP